MVLRKKEKVAKKREEGTPSSSLFALQVRGMVDDHITSHCISEGI